MLKGAPFARLESQTYDGLPVEPLYGRAAGAHAVAGRAPGAAWTIMQRVDHPDPDAANAQALDDLENGATGLILVFAGSLSANGFGLDPSPERWPACSTASISTPASPSISISARRSRHVVRDACRSGERAAARACLGRSALQPQPDRRLCRLRLEPAKLERARA